MVHAHGAEHFRTTVVKDCYDGDAFVDGLVSFCASQIQKVMLHDLRGASGQHVGVHPGAVLACADVVLIFGCLLGWVLRYTPSVAIGSSGKKKSAKDSSTGPCPVSN